MKGIRLALLLLASAAGVFLGLVPPARRESEAARREHARVREEGQRLRVRLAEVDPRRFEESSATAADGASAVRALREAALRAADGLSVAGVEVSASTTDRGMIAASGRLVVEGRLADVLRVARRLASSSSGLLLQKVSLATAREDVRLEAEAFILREAP